MQRGSVEGEVVAGRYRLDRRLGSGGMGTVWAAEDELLQRPVAVKEVTVPAGLPAPEVERMHRRYLREARAAARLRHENVVVVHDVIPETGRVWIVMELIEARDLAAVVQHDGPLTPAAAARVGLQVLNALTAAHEAGVLHRDVKPANVLICANGRAVLTDFGVASVAGDGSLTSTGQLIGSPAYLAPERLTGASVGPASDLWSLGCTLYAAVEAVSPFWRDEPFAMLSAITVERLPAPKSAGALAPVLYGLLEKDQAERWDADRTRDALEQVAAGERVAPVPAWGAPSLSSAVGGEIATAPAWPAPAKPGDSPPDDADGRRPDPEPSAESSGGAPPVEPAEPVKPARSGRAAKPARKTERAKTAKRSRSDPATSAGQPAGSPAPDPAPGRRRSWRFRLTAGALTALVLLLGGAAAVISGPGLNVFGLTARAQSTERPNEISGPAEPVRYVDPQHGYTVDVPGNWRHSCPDNGVCRFSPAPSDPDAAPDSDVSLQVVAEPAAGKTSLDLARAYDAQLATDATKHPEYRRIELGWAFFGQYRGAVLEFTYRGADGQRRHALIFRTVSRGVSYEVSFVGTTYGVQGARHVFDRAAGSLQVPE